MQDHLGPAMFALIEVLVGVRRLVELQLMGHDERRLGAAGVDQVAQLPVVGLDGALAGGNALPLEPEHAPVERELALFLQCVRTVRVLRYEYAAPPRFRR